MMARSLRDRCSRFLRIPPRTGWVVGIAGILALGLLLGNTGHEAETTDAEARFDAGFSLAYAFDRSGTAELESIRQLPFTDAPGMALHLGFSDSPLWLRVTIRNRTDSPQEGVLVYRFPYVDAITAHVPGPDGPRHIVRGDSRPLPDTYRNSHFPAFPVQIAAGEPTIVYLRVESSSVLLAPLDLLDHDRFTREVQRDQILLALLFGAVISVCLYVLTVYLTVREKAYLDFVPFSLTYALYVAVATGFGQVWLWPDAYPHANLLYFVVQGLLFASGVRFFQRYLNTAEHTPRINMIMRVLILAGLLTTVAPFLPSPVDTVLIAFVAGPGTVLVLGTAIYLWTRGIEHAAVATVGWAFSHVSSVYLYLRVLDITPYLPINHYLAAIGCAIATLYFAIALALGLRRQQARLLLAETINDTRNQFLAGMSHELRTPLNAIMGFSEMIKEQVLGPVQPAAYRDYAADIHASSRNMLSLVDDVLNISRIETGQYQLEIGQADLVTLVRSCLERHASEAEQGGVTVRLTHDAESIMVQADVSALQQAFCNVLENAIRYSPDGGTVEVSILRQARQVAIRIQDQGPGIPEQLLARIVRPFELVRSNAYAAKDGAGLGLPLARMLLELHGGSLQVNSVEGEGTTVVLLLPA